MTVISGKKRLLGYELSPQQNAIVNYLIPSVCACVLYALIIAIDIAAVYRHYKDDDPIWASLTIFIVYLPALGSYIIIISNYDMWPVETAFGHENRVWFLVKTLEHLLFPVWSMWRFAERIFWSIEAVRAKTEEIIQECLAVVEAPRAIEMYVFLQAYLHSLPQIMFQMYILIRHKSDINHETRDAQVLSIAFNLVKVAITTTYYQRFKAQKVAGKQYPWFKPHRVKSLSLTPTTEETVVLRNPPARTVIENPKRFSNRLSRFYDLLPSRVAERRRSSDIYLEPTTSRSQQYNNPDSGYDEHIRSQTESMQDLARSVDEVDGIRHIRETMTTTTKQVQEITMKNRVVTLESEISEPDFNISRIIYVEGLQEDDMAGKIIAFWWWFAFLLARTLAISVFAYFFIKDAIWLLTTHVLLVIAILVYDVRADEVRRAKAFFFLFLGLVYIFCIIEFKIRFKNAYFIYYGFFMLVFIENLAMCLVWYNGALEYIENDFWFRYCFYVVVMGSLTSFSSMIFYLTVTKPKRVLVPKAMVKVNR